MREPSNQTPDVGAGGDPAGLERRIGYTFSNGALLVEALTHRSYLNEVRESGVKDNERLEFFGDAVLGFLVGRLLLERFPESREGVLARMKASLVGEDTLAELARELGLGAYLRLGRGEERSGGRQRKSLLADAYEALLAAVYLDGGAEHAGRMVERAFGPLLSGVADGTSGRDHKTEFQEKVQALCGAPPTYRLLAVSGPPHDQRFTVAAFVGGEKVGEGCGRSKKEAEQEAAREGLALLASDHTGKQ
ncbi:ribonuclease III [Geobacter sp.]|uniref:ribonuclease III n=1 Tax=Geobacter sp. TaxID=46610 RepID=UPI00260A53E5|nr:ribonuclease III [Geobacter sp.]